MCNYFSCIITQDLKVLWDGNLTSHEELIKKHHLKDDELENREFVRIEITPNANGLLSMNRKDWNYKVDEQGTLPKWYQANEPRIASLCWKACEASYAGFAPQLKKVGEFIASIKKIKYLTFKGKINAKWNMSYGKDIGAADSAAYSAAYSAADSAARSAADSAARSAADSAARSAAYSAADSAAYSAAYSAADSAADSAAYSAADSAADSAALYAKLLMVADLDFKDKAKHMATAKAEMEVWKEGYGLVAEVSGKLYVYAVRKEKKEASP